MIHIPFPHRLSENLSESHDGTLFRCPTFCKTLRPKCAEFYNSISDSNKIFTCPYGFAVQKFQLEENPVFFIGLSIEGVNPKKDVERKYAKFDNVIRLSKKQYQSFCQETEFTHLLMSSENSIKQDAEMRNVKVAELQMFLEDTMHEVRKINNQLKTSLENLQESLESDDSHIWNIIQTMYGNTNLLSIRLGFYDYMMNPQLMLGAGKTDVHIYRKFEKVYKCLYPDKTSKGLNVIMKGNSYGMYSASSMLEIAFFIIIENAIKYSPINETVHIIFNEDKQMNQLKVSIENWGPFVETIEKDKLFERGYRGLRVIKARKTKGQGIGMYLLKQICVSNDVKLQVYTRDMKFFDGDKYCTFGVRLVFDNLIF